MCWGVRTPTHLRTHLLLQRNRRSATTPTRPPSPQYAVTNRPNPASPSSNCSRHTAATLAPALRFGASAGVAHTSGQYCRSPVMLVFRPSPLRSTNPRCRVGRNKGWTVVGSLNGGEVSAKLSREMALLVGSDEVYNYLEDVYRFDWNVTP
jgi:hypothetical protein